MSSPVSTASSVSVPVPVPVPASASASASASTPVGKRKRTSAVLNTPQKKVRERSKSLYIQNVDLMREVSDVLRPLWDEIKPGLAIRQAVTEYLLNDGATAMFFLSLKEDEQKDFLLNKKEEHT